MPDVFGHEWDHLAAILKIFEILRKYGVQDDISLSQCSSAMKDADVIFTDSESSSSKLEDLKI